MLSTASGAALCMACLTFSRMTWISAGKILIYSSIVAKGFLSVIGLSSSLPVYSASQLDCLPGDSYHPNASLDQYSMLKRKKLLASCHLVLMPSVQEPKALLIRTRLIGFSLACVTSLLLEAKE